MSGIAIKQAAAESKPVHMLLVTDDQLLQHKLSRILASQPCRITFRKPAGQANREFQHLPDAGVVLLDISTSLEAILDSLVLFCERHPKTRLVLTVPLSEMHWWIETIHAGAWECLPKPVEEAELKAVLLRSINVL